MLTSYYQARTGVGLANLSTGSSTGGSSNKKAPTSPWALGNTGPQMTDLAKSVMAGSRFIDTSIAKLDAPVANPKAAQDYKALFALHQGLLALEGLAEQASAKGVPALQLTQLQSRFAAGMKEFQSFLGSEPFSTIDLVQGAVTSKAQSAAGVKRETDTYATGVVHSGTSTDPVAAFQGNVQFAVAVKAYSGTVVNVSFDLAEMGATPRTMSNTINYMNGKLATAGVSTRFANVHTLGTPTTVKVGATSMTLPAGPDQWALSIKGVSTETLTFSAPAAAPAVYIGETAGLTKPPATIKTVAPTQQLMKYEADAAGTATTAADGKIFSKTLGPEVQAVRASATAADGSLYVLADINGKTDGQAIKGTGDVALLKYDSAGNLTYTRTLGAADSANGYALSVSADGTKVAIAGSVTGTFDQADSLTAKNNGTDSFVSMFSAAGEELWTQRRGGTADDKVTALTIGADGTVYLAGTASSAMPGATSQGGQDGYISAIAATSTTGTDGVTTWTASTKFTTQFGTAGVDTPGGIAVSGTTLVVASAENGDAVVRRYDLQPTGAPTLGLARNLGAVQSGEVTGLGFATDGSVIVGGSTHNGALAAGTVTTAYTGGRDVFVAKLSGNLVAAGTDRLSYYGADDRTASAMTVSGNSIFLTGQVNVTPPSGQTTAHDGYAAQIDPATGAVTWTKQFTAAQSEAAPTSIAVDASGASSLDRLGLPKGTIDFTGSSALKVGGTVTANDRITSVTALRPGDRFFISSGAGVAKPVTIEASDTLKTLATKIGRAASFNAKVEVISSGGYDQLKITPISDRAEVQLRAGETNRDALAALGLNEGLLSVSAAAGKSEKKTYGLKLDSSLNLSDATQIGHAKAAIANAVTIVRQAYRDMATPASATAAAKAASGPVPAYITAQIANYSQALARLTGGG